MHHLSLLSLLLLLVQWILSSKFPPDTPDPFFRTLQMRASVRPRVPLDIEDTLPPQISTYHLEFDLLVNNPQPPASKGSEILLTGVYAERQLDDEDDSSFREAWLDGVPIMVNYSKKGMEEVHTDDDDVSSSSLVCGVWMRDVVPFADLLPLPWISSFSSSSIFEKMPSATTPTSPTTSTSWPLSLSDELHPESIFDREVHEMLLRHNRRRSSSNNKKDSSTTSSKTLLKRLSFEGMEYLLEVVEDHDIVNIVGVDDRDFLVIPRRLLGENVDISFEIMIGPTTSSTNGRRIRGHPHWATCHEDALKQIQNRRRRPRSQRNQNNVLPWYSDSRICDYDWLAHPTSCSSSSQQQHNINDHSSPKKYDCFFVSGIGTAASRAGPPISNWKYYWGKVQQYVTGEGALCNTTTFIREETKVHGWDAPGLLRNVCRVLVGPDYPLERVVRNKIIFTHSMGALIVAGIQFYNVCIVTGQENNNRIFQSHPPVLGSPAASWVDGICKNPEKWTDFEADLVKFFGYCMNATAAWPSYRTMAPEYGPLQEIAPLVDAMADGRECGTSAFGLTTVYGLYLEAAAQFSMRGTLSDGMVPVKNCETKKEDYGFTYVDDYYSAHVNHLDGTCHDGNGYWGIDRQPCSWYSMRRFND